MIYNRSFQTFFWFENMFENPQVPPIRENHPDTTKASQQLIFELLKQS